MADKRWRTGWHALTLILGCAPAAAPGPDAAGGDAAVAVPDTGLDSVAVASLDSNGRGTNKGLLLSGTVVTPHESFVGQVLVVGKTIVCAQAGTVCAGRPEAAGVQTVDTKGVIVPGLIDMHNHILFDIFDGDDWLPLQSYTDHTQWPKEARYGAMLDVKQCLENTSQGKPSWCMAPYNTKDGNLKCEMDKWGELKGLIAGTTSIVGLPGTAAGCFHSLSRSIDTAHNDLAVDNVQTSALFPPSKEAADGVCKNFSSGVTAAYLIHCGEGINPLALSEFSTLQTISTKDGCLLAPGTVITHGTAFGAAEFAAMKANDTKLTWSPASNVALYGDTANIPLALDAGLTISLGPDWSMGGSQNMLDELRFADNWDNTHWNNRLTPRDLVIMATANGALSLGMGDKLGKIATGYLADLFVVDGDPSKPWEAVLAATPQQVQLVMVNGVVLYGDAALGGLGPFSPGCEGLTVCGREKFVCVAEDSSVDKLNQTLNDIRSALQTALEAVDAATLSDGWHFAPLTPLVKCAK